MKYLSRIVIALVVTISLAPIAMAQQQQASGEKHQQQRKQDTDQASQPAPPITNNQSSAYYERDDKNKPQGWHKLVAWPEGITTLAIMCTLGAIIWQAFEIRRSVNVMRQQTQIQTAGMKQWVDVETRNAVVGAIEGQAETINLHFQLFNNTDYPLTITEIETWVGNWSETWDKSVVNMNHTLPPSKEKKKPYFFYAVFKGEKGDVERFDRGTVFTINGVITYTDCLDKIRVQEFGGLYGCSPNKFDWLEPYGTVPDHEKRIADPLRFQWWESVREKISKNKAKPKKAN